MDSATARQPLPVVQSQARLMSIEFTRYVACISVLWLHAHAPRWDAFAADLPLFLSISITLAVCSAKHGRFRHRAQRLLLPWAFWSMVYAGAKVYDAISCGRSIESEFVPWMLLTGPAVHLWYLPFAFAATMFALFMAPRVATHSASDWLVWGFVAVAALLICGLLGARLTLLLRRPFSQWISVVPAVPLGLSIAAIRREGGGARKFIVLVVMIACTGGEMATLSLWRPALPYVVAMVVLAVIWQLPFPAGAAAMWLGSVSYGVYLVHPLLITGVNRVEHLEPKRVALLTACLATVIVGLLRRTPLRAVT